MKPAKRTLLAVALWWGLISFHANEPTAPIGPIVAALMAAGALYLGLRDW